MMEIQFSAFDSEPYHRCLYPGGNTPSARAAAGLRVIQEREHTPQQEVVGCVDGDTGVMVGFVKWNFYKTERPESEWNKREKVDWWGVGENENKEMKRKAEAYLETTEGTRQRIWGGRPHALCALLCVHPDHQRQGAGTLLMHWGIERARDMGLPAYLEASFEGYPLYKKLGFRDIDSMIIKADIWGGDYDRVYKAMQKDF